MKTTRDVVFNWNVIHRDGPRLKANHYYIKIIVTGDITGIESFHATMGGMLSDQLQILLEKRDENLVNAVVFDSKEKNIPRPHLINVFPNKENIAYELLEIAALKASPYKVDVKSVTLTPVEPYATSTTVRPH
jgi:hypothetical protein